MEGGVTSGWGDAEINSSLLRSTSHPFRYIKSKEGRKEVKAEKGKWEHHPPIDAI